MELEKPARCAVHADVPPEVNFKAHGGLDSEHPVELQMYVTQRLVLCPAPGYLRRRRRPNTSRPRIRLPSEP